MARVVLDGAEPNALAQMIAGLAEANVAAGAGPSRVLETTRGAVQIDVPDAGVTIGLKFVPGVLTVTSGAVPGADVRITADSATLLGLSTVPLRLGLPDVMVPAGRAVALQILKGQLRIRGLVSGLGMLRKVNELLHVNEG